MSFGVDLGRQTRKTKISACFDSLLILNLQKRTLYITAVVYNNSRVYIMWLLGRGRYATCH